MAGSVERVVDRTDDDRWAVRAGEGLPPILTTRLKKEAVAAAKEQISTAGDGGELRIYFASGLLERVDRSSTSPATESPVEGSGILAPELVATYKQVKREGKHIDKGLELLSSLVATGLVPIIAAGISPEVQTAMSEGWWAVFLATLTWSLACAGIVVLITRSSFKGMALATACVVVFLVSWGFAAYLGTGVLDLSEADTGNGSPPAMLAGFVMYAMQTYGVFGAFIGGGVGAWLGFRVAPLVDEF